MAAWLELLPLGLLLLVAKAIVLSDRVQGRTSWEKPLLLTPFLDKDLVDKARNISSVDLSDILPDAPPSHAGFITVDRKLKNHLFFWFFPSPSDPKAPLLLWLNGGPAVSSMLGLLWEHGPLEVKVPDVNVVLRKSTWVGPFSVVYVDNPVGTGYSFSESGVNGYKLTQSGYTDDLFSFITQFLKMFPEYSTRGVYIGGQSYAGKYVPALAQRIHEDQNRKRLTVNVNLQGIILGGPYFDPETESLAFYEYLYALGAISISDKQRYSKRVQDMYQSFLKGGLENATFTELFQILVLQKEVRLPSLDNYVTGMDANYSAVDAVMKNSDIRRAVHAGSGTEYHVSNTDLSELYGPDVLVSTKGKLAKIMNHYKVLIYNGDYDVVVSSIMVETALLSTPWKRLQDYRAATRKIWFNKESNNREELYGFYTRVGKFCRVVVHGAGHQTPHDAPEASLEMVRSFLHHGCVSEN